MEFIIGSVIAKALAFVDFFLGQFATAEVSATPMVGACANLVIYDAEISACGMSIAQRLSGLVEIGLGALNAVLGGVLAV